MTAGPARSSRPATSSIPAEDPAILRQFPVFPQGFTKASGSKPEVIDFTEPTSLTGSPFRADCNDHTPLAVPSSFVNATPVTPTTSLKVRACDSAFWPIVPSRTRRTSCGLWHRLLHNAHDLCQFVHQRRLGLQTSGGVADQHIDIASSRGLEGTKITAAGSAPARCATTGLPPSP